MRSKPFIKRAQQAIEFVEQYVHAQPVPIAKTQITKYFGQAQNPISAQLKSQLLICVDHYYNRETGRCKRYIRNEQGLFDLKRELGMPLVASTLQQQLDSGEFIYTDKSNRSHNAIQYIPTQRRQQILADNGYRYNFDIQCSTQTLFYQYAQRLVRQQGRELVLPHIEFYIANRSLVRNELAIRHNLEIKIVKEIITALFNGAVISSWSGNSIFERVNGSLRHIRQLQQNEYLKELRNEIGMLWKVIGVQLKQELNTRRLSGRDKSGLYRKLEEQVMGVIRKELRVTNNKFFLEHDGWRSRDMCDIQRLCDLVRNQTGYVIKIDWEVIGE